MHVVIKGAISKHWRAYGLVLYWLGFAVLTIEAAQYPGYVFHRERVPFPWIGIFVVWIILGIEAFGLYVVLNQKTTKPIRRRAAVTGLYVVTLAVLFLLTSATDMPGITYVPGTFAILTLLFLGAWGFVYSLGWAWKKFQGPSR